DAQAALERAAVIEHETRRLHHIIDRLLQLLRPERESATQLALDQVFDELLPLVEARVRLARNDFQSDCDTPVMVAAPRDVLKFAMLNVLIGVHGRLGDNAGSLAIDCVAGDTEVRLGVRALAEDGDLAGGDAQYDGAIRIAGALLADFDGRIERTRDGAVVVLPRA